ncbi:PhzF family phenazine biosynthesis protein [Neisseria leonii]|uniref:PhzF family phenazine biosynthesis protein n=1 Tax=Neisseria leonii TaxID=2995413 RepID=A0A9X4ID41_9NEIS|nr:PhzF family phenazine biosynthesis protein [Neisseria sp. 51.81]MDD9326802.1 PhzF family phenazine biosynthesis protein [Neisseria sp. 51.81]
MPAIRQYTVDAFTDRVFGGNPAAVCLLDEWLDDKLLLNIAQENNLSETAFICPRGDDFALRWFTPTAEIDLCGHATLAAAFTLHEVLDNPPKVINFHTKSGVLSVQKQGHLFLMDFPAFALQAVDTAQIGKVLGIEPIEAYLGRDLLCVFDDENTVRTFIPDDDKIAKLDGLLLHITAKGRQFDCVSRSFAPKCGVREDPVCGSGHCHIFPYWADKLGKSDLTGYQASARGGVLHGTVADGKVLLGGQAVLFAKSEIYLAE